MNKFLEENWRAVAIGFVMAISGPVAGKVFAAQPVKNVTPASYGTISKQEVFWMYTMKTRFWDDGTKVTVVYQDFESKAHREFCAIVLNVTTDRFERNVNTYINKGNAAYFVKAESENDVFIKVGRTPGAIGYLSANFVLINKDGNVEKFRIVD